MECDVHVTSDGQYLVYHDDDTGRLCDNIMINVYNCNNLEFAEKLISWGVDYITTDILE